MKQPTSKYLSKYAEPECIDLESFPENNFQHCLVIPCFDEAPSFLKRLWGSALGKENALVIVVVNQPLSSLSSTNPFNLAVFDYFSDHFQCEWSQGRLSLYGGNSSPLKWLVVDRSRCGNEIPPKQGVGLARKIGCDLAVFLHYKKLIASSWVHCSDADTLLPDNYFQLSEQETGALQFSCAVYNFTHSRSSEDSDGRVWRATQLYEESLQYYVAGLTWAGSPYNIHTIGSTLAFNAEAYCLVRGFPKRAAGEDFYLLNKLLKIAPAYQAQKVTVLIEARLSTRVPFGTGPAVEKILAMTDPEADFTYYAPAIFIALKQWLDSIPFVWEALHKHGDPLENLSEDIRAVLKEAKIGILWQHINKQVKTPETCQKAIHDWFDAFQTLKFIRRIQARQYSAMPLVRCIELLKHQTSED